MTTLPSLPEMHQALESRDASYDGIFFIAVKTTRIFCRPSCASKPTLRKNREFFATAREAIFSGYRPCKRCRPMHTNGRPPEWVEKLLKEVEANPAARLTEGELRARNVDPARLRRYFLKNYGMTFNAYCRGRRMSKAIEQIRGGAGLDEVALGNGYDSHSGFREAFARTFGQSPGRSRDADCIVTSWLESPLGPLVMGATDKGICLLEFSDRRMLETQFTTLRNRFKCAVVPGHHEHLEQLEEELARYLGGKLTQFTVHLVYPGTPFQERVWSSLLKIPYGETCSYEDLAREVGSPSAHRAVGTANGMNRIAIVIPCHRVVNKGGKLGGYGGGLWRKQYLLDLERRVKHGGDRNGHVQQQLVGSSS
jgi:AraC family transcriptional regulator, regulatory protein of adaptative response / methylated-DNA-[protein]-cysteine methyltransferase